MSEPKEPKEKKPRRTRRNYAKDWERLEMYITAATRILAAEGDDLMTTGKAEAYADVRAFMEGK